MSGPALIGVTVLVLGLTGPALAAGAGLTARHRVIGAADAAALAAADTLIGDARGEPCARAEQVAAAHRTALDGCALDGFTATVALSVRVLGIPVTARARAGPAPEPASLPAPADAPPSARNTRLATGGPSAGINSGEGRSLCEPRAALCMVCDRNRHVR